MSPAVERSAVQFGRTRIQYGIRRSSRRKTVSLTVAPPGEVTLTAPVGTPVARLDEVVHAKAKWIVGRLQLVRPLEHALPPREFVSGESFLYLGRQYRLALQRGGADASVRLAFGRLRVSLPATLKGAARDQAARSALVSWYREHASERLQERTCEWARRVGVPVPRVLVREQERRWGSCSPGVVRFNWRIIQAPMRLVDYVVAHELVHLQYEDHSRAFWAALGRVMPGYAERREALRQWGPRLTW